MVNALKQIKSTVNWARRNGLTGDIGIAALLGGVSKAAFGLANETTIWIVVGVAGVSMAFGIFDQFEGGEDGSND